MALGFNRKKNSPMTSNFTRLLLGRDVYFSIILHTTLTSAIDSDSYVNFQGKLQCKHTGRRRRRCRTLYRDSASGGETLDIRAMPYTETNSEPFSGAARKCLQIADFDRDLFFFFCCFSSKSKTILPCLLSCLLLLLLVLFSPCNTHTSPRLWSFLFLRPVSFAAVSLLFVGGTWPAAAVACMYIILWLFF